MEDVVAVRFRDAERGEACILTWGRVFDPVDPTELLAGLERVLPELGFRDAAGMRVCDSLREANDFEYFYEGLIHYAALVANERVHDDSWRALQRSDESLRRSIYLLGRQV